MIYQPECLSQLDDGVRHPEGRWELDEALNDGGIAVTADHVAVNDVAVGKA